MKLSILIGFMACIIMACSSAREASKTSAKLAQSSNDSTEYELIIIDARFDTWYSLNYSPAKDRFNEYYRSKNLVAVINWNDYYRNGRYGKVIDSYIDYQPSVDYGIEVNRKLYWYFQYIVESYEINLFGELH